MKVIAINGSPRRTWNTATLLEKALEGAASEGAKRKWSIFMTLISKDACCFACKLRTEKLWKCAMQDDLTPVLEAGRCWCLNTDHLFILETLQAKWSFMERYIFHISSTPMSLHALSEKYPVGYLHYGAKEEFFDIFGLRTTIGLNENLAKRIFGYSDTVQHRYLPLATTQNMWRTGLIPKRKQKGEKKCSLRIVRKLLKWVPDLWSGKKVWKHGIKAVKFEFALSREPIFNRDQWFGPENEGKAVHKKCKLVD